MKFHSVYVSVCFLKELTFSETISFYFADHFYKFICFKKVSIIYMGVMMDLWKKF